MSNASSSAKSADVKLLTAKVSWNWVEAVIVGVLAVIGVDVVLGLAVGLGLGLLNNQSLIHAVENGSVWFNFVFYTASRLLGLGLIVRFVRRRGVSWKDFGFRRFNPTKALGMIISASLTLLIASSLIFYLLGQTVPELDLEKEQEIVFASASTTPELVMAFLVLVVLAPLVEEVIFRGFMLPAFIRRFGVVWGVLVTSILFGLVHWQLNVGIITFMMGLLLAWIYLRTRSLLPAIMFHSLKNLVAFLLIF